jgi:hypothetical protein
MQVGGTIRKLDWTGRVEHKQHKSNVCTNSLSQLAKVKIHIILNIPNFIPLFILFQNYGFSQGKQLGFFPTSHL